MEEKKGSSFDDVNSLIQQFNKSLNLQFPLIENEIDALIRGNTKESAVIEKQLNTLLSLAKMGMAERLFIKLLEYYKHINPAKADWYWQTYDEGL